MGTRIEAVSEDGNIVFEQLTAEYLDDAVEVVQKAIFHGGNVSGSMEIANYPEALTELDQLTLESAKDGISFIAIDKNTNKVVGIAINKLLKKSHHFFHDFLKTFKHPKSRRIIELLISADNFLDLFENVDCCMEILFLGTLTEYRRIGIAKKLAQLSDELAQKLRDGINVKQSLDGQENLHLEPVPQALYAVLTSGISQRIGRQLGSTIAVERKHDTTTVTIEYKMLQKTNQ